MSLLSIGIIVIILEGYFLLCNVNMVLFLFMIKLYLFNFNFRRLFRILKIFVFGWFVVEVSEV